MSFNHAAYSTFLGSKLAMAKDLGFPCTPNEVHPQLMLHQRDIVAWGVTGGRRAFFMNFGLGKTLVQLETCRLILEKVGEGRALIVAPLGVRQEFKRDAAKIDLQIAFIRTNEEVEQLSLIPDPPRIFITNYESIREGKVDPSGFVVVSLDEAAILRGFGGTKTFRELMGYFEGTSIYRFVATATPSPNEFIELLAYADFLGVMDVGEAKTRFFKRDPTKADHLTLHPHKEREFWLWVASWAIFLQRPSDLGYSDDGYILPEIDVRWHEIPSDHSNAGESREGQRRLMKDTTMGVQEAAREKRDSLDARIAKLQELRQCRYCSGAGEVPQSSASYMSCPDCRGSGVSPDHRIIWHDLEDERRAIEKALPGCVTVYGSQDLDERERAVIDFSDGKIQELAGKPVMLGSGTNMQRFCSWAVFLGIGFKFKDFIQAIHRLHRFLQKRQVRIDLIYTEAERGVRVQLERKWAQHNKLVEQMTAIIREYGLTTTAISGALSRTAGTERHEANGRAWKAVNNDCVLETAAMESDSVGLILTSIPFSTQYEYTPSYNDFGHNEDNAAFFEQMDFLTPELLRVLQPGRIAAVHVKDRISPKGISGVGFQTVQPFHMQCTMHFQKHGFAYLGMKTIVTDVVRENAQTYRLGWSEQCKDGSRMGCGMPEYLLLFRKPPTDMSDGYADVRVVKDKPLCDDSGVAAPFDEDSNWKHPVPGTGYSRGTWQFDAHGFSRSAGDRLISSAEVDELIRTLPQDKLHKTIFRLWRDRSTHQVYNFKGHVAVAEDLDYLGLLPATFMLLPPHSWHPDVWTDITRMRTLNGAQYAKGKEMHLCPLQFDIVERAIVQMTNAGDVVYDPFGGLGTVAMCAVKLNRRGISCELSPGYFKDSLFYLRTAELEMNTPTLFDLLDADDDAEKNFDASA